MTYAAGSAFYAVLNDAIRCCSATESDSSAIAEPVSAEKLDISELGKDLGSLLHSHCTKLSLAARPPRTIQAVAKCVEDIEKLFPVFATLCRSMDPSIHGIALCDKMKNQSRYALMGVRSLVEAVSEDPVSETRLSRTGILWESCIALQQKETLANLVAAKIAESGQMIDDAESDLRSWALGEKDQNFSDLDDSGSDRDPSQQRITNSILGHSESVEHERRISMLSRIQILLKAIKKRKVTDSSPITELNDIYIHVSKLAVEVDDLAGEVQEDADPTFVAELEKAVVLRVQELLVKVSASKDDKWQAWSKNFSSKWLAEVSSNRNGISFYTLPPAYETFFENHIAPLVPCIIAGLVDTWPCLRDWRTESEKDNDYVPNINHLTKMYGGTNVSVTKSDEPGPLSMRFEQFLARLQAGEALYARDIHLQRLFPAHRFYTIPTLFRDDWLNFQLDHEGRDDYKFVYLGADKTRTSLHKDVVASHSWSTNVTGIKKWTLIPPSSTTNLFSFDEDQVVQDVQLTDSLTSARFPNLDKARRDAIVVHQYPGETIFVPSTWYHQVENIGITLSINHNWINAASLSSIFENLRHEVELSREAVLDLKRDGIVDIVGFETVVQELTFANAGMHWQSFFELVLFRLVHRDTYITAAFRPSLSYDLDIVRRVCDAWTALDYAEHLQETMAIVREIEGLCKIVI